jgi:hypothetical protein
MNNFLTGMRALNLSITNASAKIKTRALLAPRPSASLELDAPSIQIARRKRTVSKASLNTAIKDIMAKAKRFFACRELFIFV